MTAIVLPDLDRSTLEDLKERMPSLHLSDIELPSMERAGRQADRAIDRLLGRSRPSIWPWLAAAVGIAAIAGTAAALLSWTRRPAWSSWTDRTDRTDRTGWTATDTSAYPGSDTLGGETAAVADVQVTSLEEPLP